MTDPVNDPHAIPETAPASANDALVKQFNTEVAPRLEAFRRAAANDPASALQRLCETGEEVDPRSPPVRRVLQRVAAGVVECQLMARLPHLHRLWPDAQAALAQPDLCRAMASVGRQEVERTGEMLGAVIVSAVNEAAVVLDNTFDAEAWAGVLVEVLASEHVPRTGEVIDIETLRLIRMARSDCSCDEQR